MDNECRSSSLTSESSDNGEEIPSTPVESKFTRKHTRYSHHQTDTIVHLHSDNNF